MMPWVRPTPLVSFASEALELLQATRTDVSNSGGPTSAVFEGRHIWSGTWGRRGVARGAHKSRLASSMKGIAKCAWCEQIRCVTRELDVEHYRPKARVTEWRGSPPVVSDIPPDEVDVGPGYWWLAYSWSNFTLACKLCNQSWKRNLFPVESPRPPVGEGSEDRERPLLLNPATDFRSREHFRWLLDGIMEPLTPEGYATVVTVGLNRNDLLARRSKVAIRIGQVLARFLWALRIGDKQSQILALMEVFALGDSGEEFTSMVRWFVEEALGCSWGELDGAPL